VQEVACWLPEQLGLETLSPTHGWEALKAIGWSIQRPRPRNRQAAAPQEQDEFNKTRRSRCARSASGPRRCSQSVLLRRAPSRPKTHHAPRAGARRRAAYRFRTSPFRMALCDGFCLVYLRPIRLNVNRPRRSGNSSMSPSSTNISPISKPATTSSVAAV
jgi:hypothetical protein